MCNAAIGLFRLSELANAVISAIFATVGGYSKNVALAQRNFDKIKREIIVL